MANLFALHPAESMTNLIDYSEYKGASKVLEPDWGEEERVGLRFTCLYCDSPLTTAFNPSNPSELTKNELMTGLRVLNCPSCGWWLCEQIFMYLSAGHCVHYSIKGATLKSFDLESPSAPVDSLARYIQLHPNYIHDIDPTNMERLVASVFAEHYSCEVRHVGRTRDGGIDLLMVLSDEIVPVQVKRRSNPASLESVKTIREMFGVMLRDGFKKAQVVTSAHQFSAESYAEVQMALSRGALDEFILVDKASFIDMIEANPTLLIPPWRKLLPEGEETTYAVLQSEHFANYLAARKSRIAIGTANRPTGAADEPRP